MRLINVSPKQNAVITNHYWSSVITRISNKSFDIQRQHIHFYCPVCSYAGALLAKPTDAGPWRKVCESCAIKLRIKL